MTLKEEVKIRWKSETPLFWKKVQKVGIICAAVGGAIAAAPIALPGVVVVAAGYLTTAGVVASLISKFTVADSSVLTEEKN